jgi:hypothetical protein
MTQYSDSNYDPGFLNCAGRGQTVDNALASSYFYSLGVTTDLVVYNNIYCTGTINSFSGFTLGYENYFSRDLFRWGSKGIFDNNVEFKDDVNFDKSITIEGLTSTSRLVVNGREYRATRVVAKNGTFTCLATF